MSEAAHGRARVGVMVPTFNRPDLARACVLQLLAQSRPPDIVCVHQNGHPDRYDWAVADLRCASELVWMHTPARLPQHQWYAIPLQLLIARGCTHFFWADHDDLYLSDHIERGLDDLRDHDFSVSRRCGLLFTKACEYRYAQEVEFTSHAPGPGMSSTMCFNRPFAEQLLADLASDSSTTIPTTSSRTSRCRNSAATCRPAARRSITRTKARSPRASGWTAPSPEAQPQGVIGLTWPARICASSSAQ